MPHRTFWTALAAALLAMAPLPRAAATHAPPATPASQPEPAPAASGIAWLPDIVYGQGGGVDLQLNLARPDSSGDSRHPCIVIIHGGGWRAGHRRAHDDLARELAKRGYVAATVSYRFCPEHVFPAQVEDVKCAVRYLRAHADEHHLDPQRIGAIGFSAGAHLSMMLGAVDLEAGLEGEGGWAEESSKVQAVVSFFGPTDFVIEYPPQSVNLVRDFHGGTMEEQAGAYRQASPVNHVDAGDAPMLLFQGTIDPLVLWPQATRMGEALTQAGVSGRVELLLGKGHGWTGAELLRTLEGAVTFFDEHLKAEPNPTP